MTKVNPPLRSPRDVDAIKEAVSDGLVDAIATDHAPHATQDKEIEFGCAAFGISGIETLVPLALDLWREKLVNETRLISMLTVQPARVMNLSGGTLSVGAPADVTVIDPDREWTVDPEQFVSKGKNTPFKGAQGQRRRGVNRGWREDRIFFEQRPGELTTTTEGRADGIQSSSLHA